jgi:hypothetical protein
LPDRILPREQKSERHPYRDYYSPATAEEIARTYRDDLERFHYSF